jgi:hypothetical protein
MGRIPGVKMLGNFLKVGDPEFHAQIMARGVTKGYINPKVLAGEVPAYQNIVTGGAQTKANAIKELLNMDKIKDKTKYLPKVKTLGILSLINRQGGK